MTKYLNKTYGRNDEAANVLKMFNAGRNISMPGPRRLGKSFFLDRLVTNLRLKGWRAVKVELAGLSSTREVFRELCNKTNTELSGPKKIITWTKQRTFQALGSRTESSGPWYQPFLTQDYETYFERMIQNMHEDKTQRWAILIDELPIFLKTLHDKGADGIGLALNFMNMLARLMQNYPSVKWLITGSIGMEPLAKEGLYMGVMAKFENFEIQPLSTEQSIDFVCDIAKEGGVLSRSVITKTEAMCITSATGWRAAYYLDALTQKLEGAPTDDPAQAQLLVEQAIEKLLNTTESQKFSTWEEHLKKHYKKDECDIALAILKALAPDIDGKSINALMPILNRPELTKVGLKAILRRMDVEGFITCQDWSNDDASICYRNLLLRLWWKRWNC